MMLGGSCDGEAVLECIGDEAGGREKVMGHGKMAIAVSHLLSSSDAVCVCVCVYVCVCVCVCTLESVLGSSRRRQPMRMVDVLMTPADT